MNQSPPSPSTDWFWQSLTGAGLLVLASLHMAAQHFMVEGGLRDFAAVQEYLRQPLVIVIELAFLVVVTAHALLGVRAVLFDLGLSDSAEKRVTQALWVVGALTVLYGGWLTWSILAFPAS